jgi:hypothetical protein
MSWKKVRMAGREYAAGMAAAKAANMTFAKWAAIMTDRYLKRQVEAEAIEGGHHGLPALTRADSKSVYVGCSGVPGHIVRRAVAEAVVQEEQVLWNYRYRRDVLDAVIFVKRWEGESIGYEEAEKIMDERLEQRKRELGKVKSEKSKVRAQ